eukprot:COSAG01_NODE_11433_length_1936_cov_1.706042_1_plen_102_part_10
MVILLRWGRYNFRFIDQVTAMEARASELGMAKQLYYLFPHNTYLEPADLAAAEALGLGDHLLLDIHVHATGAMEQAEQFFENTTSSAGAINCEVNAGEHTFK